MAYTLTLHATFDKLCFSGSRKNHAILTLPQRVAVHVVRLLIVSGTFAVTCFFRKYVCISGERLLSWCIIGYL